MKKNLSLAAVIYFALVAFVAADQPAKISDAALKQISALHQEKQSRTPAQRKMDSRLVYAVKQSRKEAIAAGVQPFELHLDRDREGRILVDIDTKVTKAVINAIEDAGGKIVVSVEKFNSIRALIPAGKLEALALLNDVKFVHQAAKAYTRTGSTTSEGDTTHRADTARTAFTTDGTGVKVGVLSDSVDYLSNSQASGDLPSVTVLPGQDGVPATGEGTAMLEIVHDLAPGSDLYFASAFNGAASFANNILALRAAGCDVIVDDVFYFSESPFQDGIIAQAVNTVTADGALYFSAAGNEGNKTDNTSGTWEGDFVDGGAASAPVNGKGGILHSFGSTTYNTVNSRGFATVLFWSDPLGASTNDYDIYVLDSAGNNVVDSSTTVQNGSQDPFEIVSPASGQRLVVVKAAGDARYLHIDTIRGRLSVSTAGNITGHAMAEAGFGVAAVDANTSFPNPFSGGLINPVETFSSDGPRRVFYYADGTPITPGNYLSTGGTVRQKPDIAAADGVATTVPGFFPFFGTSAAAPHAAAIAALIKSYSPALTPDQVRFALTNTALDIEAIAFDRNAGAGLIMAYEALQSLPVPVPAPNLVVVSNIFSGGNGNGLVDPNECNALDVVLTNKGNAAATGVQATLSTTTPEVIIAQPTISFANIPPGGIVTNLSAFKISSSPTFICGTPVDLIMIVKSDQQSKTNTLRLASGFLGAVNRFDNPTAVSIPDYTPSGVFSAVVVSNVTAAIGKLTVSLFLTHTFDSDLRLQLVGPDGTTVSLAQHNGGSGDNFGASCAIEAFRTTFDDDATNSVSTAVPPYAGSVRPFQPLSAFVGKSGTNVNGTWQLRIADDVPIDVGALQCWSLNLYPTVCSDGGGECPGSDLGVKITSLPEPTTLGSNLTYTITVTNFGPSTAKSVTMSQLLPSSVIFVSATPSQGTCSFANGTVSGNLGSVPARGTVTIAVVVTPAAAGTISSTVTVGSAEPDFVPGNNSATAISHVVVPATDLAIGVSAVPSPALVGSPLTYTIQVTNKGPAVASGVFVTNVLSGGIIFNSATTTQGTISNNAGTVIAALGTLASGGRATISISVSPTLVGAVTASVRVIGNQLDPIQSNNSATLTTPVSPAADLSLTLSALPNPSVLGSNIIYTITVTNKGPNTANNVLISDTLAASLNFVTANSTKGVCSVSGSTVTCSIDPLLVGDTATVTIIASSTVVGTITNTAVVASSQADPTPANNVGTLSTVVASPFVSITPAGSKLVSESFSPANGAIDPGETVTVELFLKNVGNVASTNVVGTLQATGGVTAPGVAQTYGAIAAGGFPTSKTFSFTASGTNNGTVTATLQLQDGTANLGNVAYTFRLSNQLQFANTNQITIPDVGSAAPYPSTISVSGVTGILAKVSVTLSNFAHTYPHDVTALLVGPNNQKVILMAETGAGPGVTNLTLTFDDQAGVTLPDFGQLGSGVFQPTSYSASPTLPSPAPSGPYSSVLSSFAGNSPNGTWSLYIADGNAGDSGAIVRGWRLSLTTVIPVNQLANLSLTGSANSNQLSVLDGNVYRLVVSNAGPDTATAVLVTNAFSGPVSVTSFSSSQGTVFTNGSGLVVYNLGTLSSGAVASITNGVSATGAGSINLAASVSSTEMDLNTANNTLNVTTPVSLPASDISVTGSVSPSPAIVGNIVTYSIVVSNSGPQVALNVSATDTLPAGLNYILATASPGSCTYTNGSVLCNLGNLVPGGAATITITAGVSAAGTYSNVLIAATASTDANSANNSAVIPLLASNPSPNIVSAGTKLTSESISPANAAIDQGETVTLAISLQNTGSANTTDLLATFQAGPGVTAITTSQSYGALSTNGAAVTRSFTFSVSPSISGPVTFSLALSDGASLGAIPFSYALPRTTSFTNSAAIVIPENGPASPYPAPITVSGVTGLVSKVVLRLNDFNHSFPSDVDVVLVSPSGRNALVLSGAGGSHPVTNAVLSFDDSVAQTLSASGQIVSGTFAPSTFGAGTSVSVPAPRAPYASTLSTFNGVDANGDWSLYVFDHSRGDAGQITTGWTLTLTTVDAVNPVADVQLKLTASTNALFIGNNLNLTFTVTNIGPAAATGVTLTNLLPAGFAVISSNVSQGTIAGNFWNIGTLASGTQGTMNLTVRPTTAGNFVETAIAGGSESDLNLSNNSQQAGLIVAVAAPVSFSGVVLTNNQTQFTIAGQVGQTYSVETSTNLIIWTPINNYVIPASGALKITDDVSSTSAQRFYRAIRQP